MYIEKTLLKFNKDRTYKLFPGNSIISMIEDFKILELITKVKREMENSKLFDKFIFLPENSYHMTVCDLLTYYTLTSNKMFECFPYKNETNFDFIDQEIMKKLSTENFDLNVKMQVDKITQKQIRLKPKTKEDSDKLNNFRQKIYEILNIKNNSTYKFHISLNYQLEELDTKEEKINEFLEELNKKYIKQFPDISIDFAIVVAFNDMSEYRNLTLGRKNLGVFKVN